MSDTPRTDAEMTKTEGDFYYGDFARQLERELNAAHADGVKLSEALRTMTTAFDEVKAQLDAALNELDKTNVILVKTEAFLAIVEREFIHAK